MTLACFAMGLTFEEALNAATINAAYALDRHDRVGSLEPGKQCDVVVVNGPPVELLRVGAATIQTVIKRGRVVTLPQPDRTRPNRINPCGCTRQVSRSRAFAPIRAEPVGVTRGAEPADENLSRRHAGSFELVGVGAPDVEEQLAGAAHEPSCAVGLAPAPCAKRGHELLTHLVATRPDARADGRRQRVGAGLKPVRQARQRSPRPHQRRCRAIRHARPRRTRPDRSAVRIGAQSAT